MVFDPLHYLALLEQKTNALDQAAPLAGWALPEEFGELRRQMEARQGKRARREYVQVLRLLETFSLEEVAVAVREALRFPAIAFDAVKHLLLCAIERRPPKLDLENYPHLPVAEVALTVQKSIHPANLLASRLFNDADWALGSAGSLLIDDLELHDRAASSSERN
jgi:hypothetical protein